MYLNGKDLHVKKSKIKAAITIEIALSLALVVIVLFLILGMFCNNLQALASHSGIYNFFNRKNEDAKTFSSADYHEVDPTKTQINVQVVADQGLDWYLTQAQSTVDKYKDSTDPLSKSQLEDLAKALTILNYDNYYKNGTASDAIALNVSDKYGIAINITGGRNSTCYTYINASTSNISSSDVNEKFEYSYSAKSNELAGIRAIAENSNYTKTN